MVQHHDGAFRGGLGPGQGVFQGFDLIDEGFPFIPGKIQQLVAITFGPADRPALWMSAWGKPTNKVAIRAPSASMRLVISCRSLLGKLAVPWRITWGSMGRLPQAMVGMLRPASISNNGRPVRSAVS